MSESMVLERLTHLEADWADVERRSRRLRRQRPHLTKRRLVAALAVVVLALALPALALSGVLGSLFGFSDHGKPAHATAFNRHEINGRIWRTHGIHLGAANVGNPDTLRRLAFREGIGVYSARSKKGSRACYYTGRYYPKPDPHPNRLHLGGSCIPKGGFPSPAQPVLILSLGPLAGVTADGVRSIQFLALSDCHPVVTVPVIHNVYIDAHPPTVPLAFLVARNASGKIVWHTPRSYFNNQYQRVPIDRNAPRDCGLGG